MRLVVTRPQADSERTAAALRARGHEVLVAPLMRVEPVAVELSGGWGGVIITSANAPAPSPAIRRAGCSSCRCSRSAGAALKPRGRRDLPTSRRPAATCAIWCSSIAARHADAEAPLLYLAGEDRAADLVAELAVHGIAAEMRSSIAPLPRRFRPN